jgi:SAM-dependent methyltransferase
MGESGVELRRTFEAASKTYDEARPSYPAALFDDLVELAGLNAGAGLLEIGCATGKATLPLLKRGFAVVCIELGERLADEARANLAGYPAEIHLAPFESWTANGRRFDLVYAATAWHWIDPAVRFRKAYELLLPEGHLALWSAMHAIPTGYDPFFAEIQLAYDAIGESVEGEWPPPVPDQVPDDAAAIEATGLFADVAVRRYVWENQYTADEYIALLNTFSGHIAMDADKREYLYREIRQRLAKRPGSTLLRHWHSILHVARRTD